MYEHLSRFAQTGGLIYFFAIFAVVLVYALWPRNQKRFDEAAQLPLQDREPGDE
ncbi:cbb3-type cytochrome c oxidase subunit 3 [Henriciella aquimarina]|uniref:cbb3-type cytochrome c oxidase subunit 3 n=1 Tax=Henriciella aquimarina TaxID=545261 RepID=UPI000A061F82|nr:cbb3-type cytochrome c oxidase subunit 3 [Henriciella aquimarina]